LRQRQTSGAAVRILPPEIIRLAAHHGVWKMAVGHPRDGNELEFSREKVVHHPRDNFDKVAAQRCFEAKLRPDRKNRLQTMIFNSLSYSNNYIL
jgi:hypothetical protein